MLHNQANISSFSASKLGQNMINLKGEKTCTLAAENQQGLYADNPHQNLSGC